MTSSIRHRLPPPLRLLLASSLAFGLTVPPIALASEEPSTASAGEDPHDPQGPMPSQEVQRPVGEHKRGEPIAPGPPSPCLAKAQVFVPWSLCRDLGAPARGDAPQRLEGYVQADPPMDSPTPCALVCTPDAKMASWSFLVPVAGYQGRLECAIGPRLRQSLTLGPPDTGPSAGVAIQWQTNLEVTTYILEDESLMQAENRDLRTLVYHARRRLDPQIGCPAGQPTAPPP
ncbi:MAG: hypothetical protein EA397_15765 [Deltaproteobacteria bacterium]|nr:MAG: hypothetical protein EA397_15765 [Deltaproteobacteria bacterium]